jgi:hypothetical protein
MHLPHIEFFLNEGQITIGTLQPVGCVAIANDDHNTLAMLKRRRGESLQDLLLRLDQAIAKAQDGEEFIDEVNG